MRLIITVYASHSQIESVLDHLHNGPKTKIKILYFIAIKMQEITFLFRCSSKINGYSNDFRVTSSMYNNMS